MNRIDVVRDLLMRGRRVALAVLPADVIGLPAKLRNKEYVRLDIRPHDSVVLRTRALLANLSFDGIVGRVAIPWEAIFAVADADGSESYSFENVVHLVEVPLPDGVELELSAPRGRLQLVA